MKKILTILTAVVLMLMLSACSFAVPFSSDKICSDLSDSSNHDTEQSTEIDDGDSGESDTDSSNKETLCHIVFDVYGGNEIIEGQYINRGEKIRKPVDPTKKNTADKEYEFVGWYYGDNEWNFETDVVQQDMTLVAKWKVVVEYTVPFLPE